MRLTAKLQLHWRHYGWTERGFVLLPLLVLMPRLLNHPRGGHNGEVSQEFAITLALLALLGILAIEARRNTHLHFSWRGRDVWLLLATALFALWSAVSLLWTADLGATQDHTVLWLSYTTLLFIGRIVLRKRSLMGLAAMLVTTGLILALLRLIQYWVTSGERSLASALYLNLGVEPELLVMILPLVLVLQLTVRRSTIALLCLVIAALMWMGSLSTYQRTPILALLVTSFCLGGGLLLQRGRLRSPLRLVILGLVLCVVSAVQLSLPSKIQGWNPVPNESGKDFVAKQVKGIRTMEMDTSSRLQFWGAGIKMVLAHPLQGVGAGAYKTTYLQYRRSANAQPFWGRTKDYSQVEGTESTYRAHNEFVEVLSELGAVGLILLMGLLLALAVLLRRSPLPQRWVALSVGTGVAAFLISSNLSSFSFRWIPCGFTFFLLTALLLPLTRNRTAVSSASRRVGHSAVTGLILLTLLSVARTSQVIGSEYYELQGQAEETIDPEQSEQLYQKAMMLDPHNFSVSAHLGELLYRTKRPQEAVAPLERGLRYGVNNIQQQALLSFAHAQSGDQVRAREVLQTATQAYPDSLFLRALYVEALEREGQTAVAQEQRAVMQAINTEETEVWERVIRFGIKAATTVAREKNLIHPAKLLPKNGLGVLLERERLYSISLP